MNIELNTVIDQAKLIAIQNQLTTSDALIAMLVIKLSEQIKTGSVK